MIIVTSAEAGINTALQGKKYCVREVSEEEMEDFGGNHSIALVTAVLISTKPASCSANCSSTPPAICCHPQKDVHRETSAVSPQSNTLWDVSQEYTEELCHEQGFENNHRTSSPIPVPLIDIYLGLFSSLILAGKKINEIIALESRFIFV